MHGQRKRAVLVFLVFGAAGLGVRPAAAGAEKFSAACQPLVDAARKVIMTPNHLYETDGLGRPGEKARSVETVSTGGVTYIELNGTWKRSPLPPKQAVAEMDSNLATITVYSCTHVGDESVAGSAAAVYTSHTENAGVKTDVRTWVAKSSGLILGSEEEMDIGGGHKRHLSIRYEYTNVQAPAGVK